MDENEALLQYPADLAQQFLSMAVLLCQITTYLGNHFHTKGERLFNFTIKNHVFLHGAWSARFLNPVRAWCYAGEDLMNRIKVLVQRAARTRLARHEVCNRAMEQYVRGLSCTIARCA